MCTTLLFAAIFAIVDDPQKRAVVVGINDYQHPKLQSLKHAERDARDLEAELKILGYRVELLVGRDATKNAVEQKIKEAADGCKAGETLLVAFAGHGAQFIGAKDSFFIPSDGRPSRERVDSLVSLQRVYGLIDGSFAAHKIVLVDACRNDPDPSRGRGIDDAPSPPLGVAALFSCSATERAYESDDLKHGVFFHCVLQGLRGEAADRRGRITYGGLASYVALNVRSDVPRLIGPDKSQSPNSKANYNAEPVLGTVEVDARGPTLTVSLTDPAATHKTIAAAIAAAERYGRIVVLPGVYRESLIIDKPLSLIGKGRREEIVVESSEGSCLILRTSRARVSGLTFRCIAGKTGKQLFAIDVPEGRPTIDDCDVTSDSHAGIGVHGSGAAPTFRSCDVHDGKSVGIFVYEEARGAFEDCEIYGNQLAGVEVKEKGDPVVRKCRVHDGNVGGIFVHKQGRGTFEDCEVYGNRLAGVEVREQGEPALRKCRVHDGKFVGILVFDAGRGTFEDCDVYGNQLAGFEVREMGDPAVRKCKFHDGKWSGIFVHKEGRGAFEDCDIYGNQLAGIEVKEKGDPVVQKCRFHGGKTGGIMVYEEARGTFEDCDIYGNQLTGFTVQKKGNPAVRKCKFFDGSESGVLIHAEGRGTFEDCEVYGNQLTGFTVQERGDPIVRKCRFHHGKTSGVLVHREGRGTFEECEIYGNQLSGIEVREKGDPAVRKCRFHDGKAGGIFVYDEGRGAFEHCDVYANKGTGITVQEKGDPRVRKCRINRNEYEAVLVRKDCHANIEDCDLTGNGRRGAFYIGEGAKVDRRNNKE